MGWVKGMFKSIRWKEFRGKGKKKKKKLPICSGGRINVKELAVHRSPALDGPSVSLQDLPWMTGSEVKV